MVPGRGLLLPVRQTYVLRRDASNRRLECSYGLARRPQRDERYNITIPAQTELHRDLRRDPSYAHEDMGHSFRSSGKSTNQRFMAEVLRYNIFKKSAYRLKRLEPPKCIRVGGPQPRAAFTARACDDGDVAV